MKGETISGLVLALGLALVVGAVVGMLLIGEQTLRLLVGVLVVGGALSGVILACAAVVRAWRKNDAAPIERQVIREVRILDNRPQVPQLPAPQNAPWAVFPELLRSSYRAGLLSGSDGRADTVDAQVRELGAGDSWQGDITP